MNKDIKNWTIEDCRAKHLEVKMHPWRTNHDRICVIDYCKKLNELVTGAYWFTDKKGHESREYKALYGMNHDFIGCINRLGRNNGVSQKYKNSDGTIFYDETLTNIENGISVIHCLCDERPIERYWVYYTGCNNIPGVPRFHAMKWEQPKRSTGRFRCELDTDAMKALLNYYEKQTYKKYYIDNIEWLKNKIVENESLYIKTK